MPKIISYFCSFISKTYKHNLTEKDAPLVDTPHPVVAPENI